MRRDVAVFSVQNRFSGMQGNEVRIINEMQVAQEQFEADAELPWFLIRRTEGYEITPEGYLIPPRDYLMEYEEDDNSAVWVKHDDLWWPLKKVQQSKWFNYSQEALGPRPMVYDVIGTEYYFWPAPQSVLPMRLIYYGKDRQLDSNIENGWLQHAPNLLIGAAGYAMCAFAGPQTMQSHAQYFQGIMTDARRTLFIKSVARREANLERWMDMQA